MLRQSGVSTQHFVLCKGIMTAETQARKAGAEVEQTSDKKKGRGTKSINIDQYLLFNSTILFSQKQKKSIAFRNLQGPSGTFRNLQGLSGTTEKPKTQEDIFPRNHSLTHSHGSF